MKKRFAFALIAMMAVVMMLFMAPVLPSANAESIEEPSAQATDSPSPSDSTAPAAASCSHNKTRWESNVNCHVKVCTICYKTLTEVEEHDYPLCKLANGEKTVKCYTCKYEGSTALYETLYSVVELNLHGVIYGTYDLELNYTSKTHWYSCRYCNFRIVEREHSIFNGKCTTCGYEEPLPDPEPKIDEKTKKLSILDAKGNVVKYTGFEKFNNADFYFEDGVVRDDLNGVVKINGSFYACDHGRVMKEEMLVPFETGVFFFKNGVIDGSKTGLYEFNGQKFVFVIGQFQPNANGPWQNPVDKGWYYVINGQFAPSINGIVPYDGAKFLFIDGKLAKSFNGIYKDTLGNEYNIIGGQVYD